MKTAKEKTESPKKPPSERCRHRRSYVPGRKLKIIVLYNKVEKLLRGLPVDILPERDTLDTARDVSHALKLLGHQVSLFAVNEETYKDIFRLQADLFFNLAEGVGSLPGTEYKIPQLLEKLKVPFTGADVQNIKDTTDKGKTKRVIKKNGLSTPYYRIFKNGHLKIPKNFTFPLIVKPLAEDCSLGIFSSKAVVSTRRTLKNRIKFIHQYYKQPALVENFINTREVNVAVIGNGKKTRALPISEIVFGPYFDKKKLWKIVDFAAKWQTNTKRYKQTIGVCPADLPENLTKKIKAAAVRAYKLLKCRDYARVDIRIDEDGKFYILEINSNPSISDSTDCGLTRSAKAAGFTYKKLIDFLVKSALERKN